MKYFETDKIELKEKINETLSKEIESFLNTDGGVIYIGVKDDGEIVGVTELDDNMKKISDIVTDQIEPNAIEIVNPEVVFEDKQMIIKINIKKGLDSLYCIKKYGYSTRGCHQRVGTTCKEMTKELIKYRYELKFQDNDLMIKKPTYYGSISLRLLKLYFVEKGYHINDLSFEKNLKLKTINNDYNILAELLSDSNSFPFIVVKFKGKDKTSISERSDYGRESILLAYEKIKNRLIAENICASDTSVRPRKDTYLFDMDAVNEVLINAIIHNDYNITQPLISLFDDRIEIISHGGLPLGLTKEQFFMGISKPRNEALMEIFTRVGIVEHTGHGIPTVLSKYGRDVFDIQDNYINVTIPFNEEVLNKVGVINGVINGAINNLSTFEKQVYNEVLQNKFITAAQLSDKLRIPSRSIQRYISNLKNMNFIERVGSNKGGFWKILK